MNEYFVVWKTQRRGPYADSELRTLIKSGRIHMLATVFNGTRELTVEEFLQLPARSEAENTRSHSNDAKAASPAEKQERKTRREDYRGSIPRRRVAPDEHGSTVPLIVGGYAISLASVFFAPLVLGVAAAIVALVLMGTKKTMPGVLLLFFTLLFAGIGIVNTRQAGTGSSNLTSGSIAMDLPTLRAATKPSVVHVIALDSNGEVNATGSGFFVAPFTVVTNHHVVEGASDVLFVLDDGSEVPCDGVVGVDPSRDIAILRSESSGEKFLKVASNAPAEGERVAVIGSPLGLEGTLSEGIVSAVRFNEDRVELIQISAPISPGSSGSPVVDRFGNVVGVATMIFTGGQSINFAVSGVELTHVLDKTSKQPNDK